MMAHFETVHFDSLHAPHGTQYSTGNTKIGLVYNTSVDADRFCPEDAPCKNGGCYFCSLCKQRPTVLKAANTNGTIRGNDLNAYLDDIEYMVAVAAATGRKFRIHVGGDFSGENGPECFAGIMRIAIKYPGTIFGMTKSYCVVNEYIRTHGGTRDAVLDYFRLRFSPWPEYDMPNEYNMPVFAYTTDPYKVSACPEQAAKIRGIEWDCTKCAAAGIGCFSDPEKVPVIYSIDHNAEQKAIRARRKAGLKTWPKKEK